MKSENEIRLTLDDSKTAIMDCEMNGNHGAAKIFQGWVEALEYVLNDENYSTSETSYTQCQKL